MFIYFVYSVFFAPRRRVTESTDLTAEKTLSVKQTFIMIIIQTYVRDT